MKSIINIIILAIAGLSITSCEEMSFGNKFLGDEPQSSDATLDTMFSSAAYADKVLAEAYVNLPYGIATGNEDNLGGQSLDCVTDLAIYCQGNPYYTGEINASSSSSSQVYLVGGETDWKAIRYAWIYIENVDRVPDMTAQEKAERIAEAKMIIAISYTRMLRGIGGAPWIDHSIETTENMQFPRETFAQTVERIVTLLDEAAPNLKWKQSAVDDGRMTKAGALALKLRVLLFAASPTFNSDTKWHPQANEYTCYGNYDKARWDRAKKAGEDFMQALAENGQYELILPAEDTPEGRRLAFRKGYYERGGTEILISTRKGYGTDTHSGWYGTRYYWGPTLNYVNMFPWADGTDFPEDYNWANPSKAPFYDENHQPTRDPRLYETAAVPGEKYYSGTSAPVFFGHPDYRKGASTGFMAMKFILTQDADRAGKAVQFPYLRLPEVLLSYAEAINESENGPSTLAYNCVNEVRARVGLKALPNGLSKTEFREAILKERALELGLEDVRWYDLVRWGRVEDFTKKLNILYSYIKEGDVNDPKSFRYEVVEWSPERYWKSHWDTKWYLSPIPQNEINKNYGWTQNPGW